MMRVKNKIKPAIADKQRGFVEGKGTKNAINTLRAIIERALEVQRGINLYCTEAFDRPRHDDIITHVTQLKINGQDLRVTKNMHREQTTAMREDGEISSLKNNNKIKRGVRQ